MASIPIKSILKQSKAVPSNLSEMFKILYQRELSYEHLHTPFVEVANEPLVPFVQHSLQTVRKTRKVADALWSIKIKISGSGKTAVNIDVDGVYFSSDGIIQYLSTVICAW